jgi:restriction endonuclease S subunit
VWGYEIDGVWVSTGNAIIAINILDKFDAIINDLSSGLPAEIDARRKQHEYYRNKLLSFKEKHI